MKQPDLEGDLAAETLYSFDENDKSKVANPTDTINIFGPPALGNHYRDVRNLAILLENMHSGMNTYCVVFDALQRKYGAGFKTDFLNEVHQ